MMFADVTIDPNLQNILVTVGPAIVAFLLGHFHVVLPAPAPKTPTAPVLPVGQGGVLQYIEGLINQYVPQSTPGQLNPIGKGGILQAIGVAIHGILASPTGTTAEKTVAINSVINTVTPFAVDQPAK